MVVDKLLPSKMAFGNRRVSSSLFRTAGRYGRTAAMYYASRLGRRAGMMMQRRRGMTMTRNRRQVRSGNGVTTQHDRQLVYRKRTMPRFKKRRWRSFIKRVNAVSEKDLGSRTVVRNNLVVESFTMNLAGESFQEQMQLGLYTNRDSAVDHLNDIGVMTRDTDVGTTGKLLFHSAILDCTFRNTSSHNAVDTLNFSTIRLECDVYEISSSAEWGNANASHGANTLKDVFGEGATDTANVPGSTNSLVRTRRGWSPWDLPSALSEYRIKIWKKTKFIIGEGETFTYQMRDPKRHRLDRQRMNINGNNLPGFTRFLYVVYKPVPGYVYTDLTPDTVSLSCGVTRKYMYKVLDKTQDFDYFQT